MDQRLSNQQIMDQRLGGQQILDQRISSQQMMDQRLNGQQLLDQRLGGQQLLEQRVAEQLTERGHSELTVQAETLEHPSRTDARKLRPRRPRTFYLLEDYLAPVRGGLELDECVGPRILFPPPRPAPPTPEWETPSLSPQPSGSTVMSTPRTTTSFLDPTIVPSPGLSGNLYSPVFSPRETTYPRYVTPEMSLSEHPPQHHPVMYPSGHVTLDGRRRHHPRNKVGRLLLCFFLFFTARGVVIRYISASHVKLLLSVVN